MKDIILINNVYHPFLNVFILLLPVSVALVSVLSAVGICERCRMESGGVYFLVSHVLGSKFGGALGLLYVFGQVSIIGPVADESESLGCKTGIFLTSYVAVIC